MGDEIRNANVVRLERSTSSGVELWVASIGPADGPWVAAARPVDALLALVAHLRDVSWPFDDSWLDTSTIEPSPNVIVVRALGPIGWRGWYATSFAHPKPFSFGDRDPLVALAGFALRMREQRHILDPEFRFERTAAVD